MALSTPPSRNLVWVGIHDVFEIKRTHGIDHAPGVVVVLTDFPSDDHRRHVGTVAVLRTADGLARTMIVEDTRDHGTSISLFFSDLVKSDIPPDATIGIGY